MLNKLTVIGVGLGTITPISSIATTEIWLIIDLFQIFSNSILINDDWKLPSAIASCTGENKKLQ